MHNDLTSPALSNHVHIPSVFLCLLQTDEIQEHPESERIFPHLRGQSGEGKGGVKTVP